MSYFSEEILNYLTFDVTESHRLYTLMQQRDWPVIEQYLNKYFFDNPYFTINNNTIKKYKAFYNFDLKTLDKNFFKFNTAFLPYPIDGASELNGYNYDKFYKNDTFNKENLDILKFILVKNILASEHQTEKENFIYKFIKRIRTPQFVSDLINIVVIYVIFDLIETNKDKINLGSFLFNIYNFRAFYLESIIERFTHFDTLYNYIYTEPKYPLKSIIKDLTEEKFIEFLEIFEVYTLDSNGYEINKFIDAYSALKSCWDHILDQ